MCDGSNDKIGLGRRRRFASCARQIAGDALLGEAVAADGVVHRRRIETRALARLHSLDIAATTGQALAPRRPLAPASILGHAEQSGVAHPLASDVLCHARVVARVAGAYLVDEQAALVRDEQTLAGALDGHLVLEPVECRLGLALGRQAPDLHRLADEARRRHRLPLERVVEASAANLGASANQRLVRAAQPALAHAPVGRRRRLARRLGELVQLVGRDRVLDDEQLPIADLYNNRINRVQCAN